MRGEEGNQAFLEREFGTGEASLQRCSFECHARTVLLKTLARWMSTTALTLEVGMGLRHWY